MRSYFKLIFLIIQGAAISSCLVEEPESSSIKTSDFTFESFQQDYPINGIHNFFVQYDYEREGTPEITMDFHRATDFRGFTFDVYGENSSYALNPSTPADSSMVFEGGLPNFNIYRLQEDRYLLNGTFLNDTTLLGKYIKGSPNRTGIFSLIKKEEPVFTALIKGSLNSNFFSGAYPLFNDQLVTAGYYQGEQTVESGESSIKLTSKGGYDAFISFFSLKGKINKIAEFKSDGQIILRELRVFDGQVIAVMKFTGTIEFLGESIKSKGSSDGLVVSLNKKGELNWYRQLSSPGVAGLNCLYVDDSHIYVSGYATNSYQISDFKKNVGNSTPLVLKLNSQGQVIWSLDLGEQTSGGDYFMAKCLDGNDRENLSFAHYVRGDVLVEGEILDWPGDPRGLFTSLIDKASGQIISKQLVSTNSNSQFRVHSIFLDNKNSIHLTGRFTSRLTFPDGRTQENSGERDYFLMKID